MGFTTLLALLSVSFGPATQKSVLTLDRLFGGEFVPSGGKPTGEWLADGKTMLAEEPAGGGVNLIEIDAATGQSQTLVRASQLTPGGQDSRPLRIERYSLSDDAKHLLIFTNSSRVWRQNTKGDFWVLNMPGTLVKVGADFPASSLMFAKLSPDGSNVGFVFKNNLYVQNLASGKVGQITTDGSDTLINGTSDWVYEEELDLRDAWRWSPDGKSIAYWQINSSREPMYTLIDDTDALYPTTKWFPYPKAGQTNPSVRIGVVPAAGGQTTWVDTVATSESGYLARMDWAANSNELIIQRLNRLQNQDDYLLADVHTGKSHTVYTDSDPAWVDVQDTGPHGVRWRRDGSAFLVFSEKAGWRHIYSVSREGSQTNDLTPGEMDVEVLEGVDEGRGTIYFTASPKNATQRYLFKSSISAPKPSRVTPEGSEGTNSYTVSPTGAFALHVHSRFGVPDDREIVSLPDHSTLRSISDGAKLKAKLGTLELGKTSFLELKTANGEEMDASLILPPTFDPHKRYPLFFSVYGEPAGTTVHDSWSGFGYLFDQMLAEKGYIVASVDNRGTPSLKGRAWRKSVYKKIGIVASEDQAAAAKQLSKLPYVDPGRIGIWGWSGGGSMTLNMLFRYPGIYKLGMSVAPVPDCRLYDTIYQERYMGLPQDNPKVYRDCSPITYARHLKGSLLIVHGSGDDNVHYQGTERLVNELVAANLPFQLMVYPNRSHGIYEGPGTSRHLYELLVRFLTTNMPPGGR